MAEEPDPEADLNPFLASQTPEDPSLLLSLDHLMALTSRQHLSKSVGQLLIFVRCMSVRMTMQFFLRAGMVLLHAVFNPLMPDRSMIWSTNLWLLDF